MYLHAYFLFFWGKDLRFDLRFDLERLGICRKMEIWLNGLDPFLERLEISAEDFI